ncbi:orange carotenoid protein N-terminal domain-containing protein [Myxacorys almedinensis]|uniref:Orange carotenoid protein n=1 Tax=Myxacorys almedinensis A TaxID=2690445 RepID=A0A8J7Z7P3_9CYAN|nr:orange carotenoid protein N-terminal domain-containing protein [Myxacorys almedinensis]NDJ19651.1 Orange carotenoid protein [Myxacorys almedinensis A]
MTYATDQDTTQALEAFRRYDVDTQLALLWFGYLDIKDNLTPDPAHSADVAARAYYDRIQELSPEQQLQAQQDILSGATSEWGRTYSALSSSARLEVWLLLGQGMEDGSIIQVPSDYQLPSETDSFTEMIKKLTFEQRINFMRSAVMEMGTPTED